MSEKIIIPVTDNTGFTYTIQVLSKEEGERKILEHNGQGLPDFSTSDMKYYHLDTDEVVALHYYDSTLYSSYQGFLSNVASSGPSISKKITRSYPIPHVDYLPDGRKIHSFQIDPEEAKAFAIADHLLLESTSGQIKTYSSAGGEILEVYREYDYCLLFQSREDWEDLKALQRLRNENYPYMGPGLSMEEQRNNIIRIAKMEMCGRNPYGSAFPLKVDELIVQLPGFLQAPNGIFDLSRDGLAKIDAYLYKKEFTAIFADQIFLPLLAYLGKTFIHLYAGNWLMEFDQPFNTWIPCMVNAEGQKRHLFMPLLNILDPYEIDECGYTALATVLGSKT